MARLRNATEAGAGSGKGPKISGSSSQYLQGAGSAAAGRPNSPPPFQQGNKGGIFGRTFGKVSDGFAKFTGLGSSKLGDVMAVGSIEDLDAYYEKLGTFCGIYARAVFDRMSRTVPKAIILCQVIRSRDRLLDQLFNYISRLNPKEIEFMLQEDPTASRRRAAAQQSIKDLMDAQEEVRKVQEKRATVPAGSGRSETEEVSIRSLLLAGAYPLVPNNMVPPGVNPGLLYGEHSPLTLIAGSEAVKQLGPPVKDKDGKERPAPEAASASGVVAAENGRAAPPAVSTASSGSAAAGKPRRLPPPPPK